MDLKYDNDKVATDMSADIGGIMFISKTCTTDHQA